MSGQDSNGDDRWKVQTFSAYPGKRFLNIGVALYEIVADSDLGRFDESAQLVLYPYRDVATGTLIKPGEEGLCKSTKDTTLVVAKIVAGQQWTTPRAARAGISERVARQRAEFDLRNGASQQTVNERLQRDLAKSKADPAAENDEQDGDDDAVVDWDAVRKQVDGTDDNNVEFQNTIDDVEEEEDDDFEPEDDDTLNAFSGAFEEAAAAEDDDEPQNFLPGQERPDEESTKKKKKKRSGFDAPAGTFASYGLLSGAPSGAPVLNIDCSRVDPVSGYASAGYASAGLDDGEEDEADKHHRSLLADMDQLDRAARGEYDDDEEEYLGDEEKEYDNGDDGDDGDENEKDYDADVDDKQDDNNQNYQREEFDAQGRQIMHPNNVELDRNGRIARRLDNALTGASSQDAQVAQYRRELNDGTTPSIRPRKTLNAAAALAERGQTTNKTLGDELKDFGLPPDMMAMLAQQGALGQQVDDGAQFPQSIDEIAHLARPFKSSNPNLQVQATSKTTSNSTPTTLPNFRTEQPPQSLAQDAPQTVAIQKNTTTQKPQKQSASVTIPISLGDLLSIRTSITAQMRAITALSESVDTVLLAKMANI